MSDFRLKVFYSVAKNLSFTKASQELFVSQPAVTKHVHELESMYHVRLFDRTNNKISLTEAGKVLMEHCERILTEYRKLEYDMHLLNNEYAGELRLGASTTIAQYILPPILAKFTEKYPQIRVSLIDTNSRNVENAVAGQRIERRTLHAGHDDHVPDVGGEVVFLDVGVVLRIGEGVDQFGAAGGRLRRFVGQGVGDADDPQVVVGEFVNLGLLAALVKGDALLDGEFLVADDAGQFFVFAAVIAEGESDF